MRLEMRSVARAALVLLVAVPLWSCQPDQSQGVDSQHCRNPSDVIEVELVQAGGQCVVKNVEAIRTACVERNGKLRWAIKNASCKLDAGRPAINSFTQPKPQGNQPAFEWTGCTPPRNGFAVNQSVDVDCLIPAGAAEGRYKYGLEGPQIKSVDPGVDVRRDG